MPASIYWASKVQTQFALSSAEAEFLALSAATRYAKFLIYLLEEIKQRHVADVVSIPTVRCRVFEDKVAALEIAKVPKMRPRTRHLNCVYHHFRNEVANKRILRESISNQQADILTNCCNRQTHVRHRRNIMGW